MNSGLEVSRLPDTWMLLWSVSTSWKTSWGQPAHVAMWQHLGWQRPEQRLERTSLCIPHFFHSAF
jgi:hypothetical protein